MIDPQSWHLEILLKMIFCGTNEIITFFFTNMGTHFNCAHFNSFSFNKHRHLWEISFENPQVLDKQGHTPPVFPSRGSLRL